jgi:glutamine synthetase
MPSDRAGGSAASLPAEWGQAIDRFATSEFAEAHLGRPFRDLFTACKRQDFDGMLARITDVEYDAYRDAV